jgi:hypothetical protein
MKVLGLIIYLFSFSALADRSCIKNPLADYQIQFSLPSTVQWRASKIELKKNSLGDINLTTEEQCGSRGCEGALYWQKEKDCYERVMIYEGTIAVIAPLGVKFADIEVNGAIHRYNTLRGKYD